MLRRSPLGLWAFLATASPPIAAAQVSISPRIVEPADLARFAIQVANATDTAIVTVRVEVPEALAILGVDVPPGWTQQQVTATDSTPPAIEWAGGRLGQREFQEFAFFARLGANVRRTTLFFPVRIGRADGSARDWRPGGYGQAPEVVVPEKAIACPAGRTD